jgi:hypothetical protein
MDAQRRTIAGFGVFWLHTLAARRSTMASIRFPVRSFLVAGSLSLAACQSMTHPEQYGSDIRARNVCELRELESVGYMPWESDYFYPQDLHDAQARLRAKYQGRSLSEAGVCTG